jgi:excisionase family DNA binding protein
MTVREVAKRLEISISMVYALCSNGRLPHTRIGLGRGTIRIQPEDLTSFLEACRTSQPPPHLIPKHIKVRSGGPTVRRP